MPGKRDLNRDKRNVKGGEGFEDPFFVKKEEGFEDPFFLRIEVDRFDDRIFFNYERDRFFGKVFGFPRSLRNGSPSQQ